MLKNIGAKRTITELSVSFVLSLLAVICFVPLRSIVFSFGLHYLGSMGAFMLWIVICAPAGSVIGIIIADKRFATLKTRIIAGFVAYIVAVIGGFLSLFLLGTISEKVAGIGYLPVIVTISFTIYHLAVKNNKQINTKSPNEVIQ